MARRSNSKRKNGVPPAFVVGGIFFLIFSIIFIFFVNFKIKSIQKEVTKVKKDEIVEKKRQIPVDINLDEKLKIFLFDHEVSKERLKAENVVNNNGIIFHKYRMLLSEMEAHSIKPALISYFKNNSFKVQDNGRDMIFDGENVVVEISIDFLEKQSDSPPGYDGEKGSKSYTENAEKKAENKIERNTDKSNNLNRKVNYTQKFAIILDDSGQNIDLAKKVVNMKYPIVLSVLPFTEYDKETVALARSKGKEVFLHLPMEPKSYPDTKPGKGAILLNMPLSIIDSTLKDNFDRLGKVDGVNNHMGSAFTENREKMAETLSVIKKYVDIFVDSHTTADTVAYEVCKKIEGLRCGINKRFIDNSGDKEYIKNKLYEAASFLSKQDVIVIGHLRSSTVETLEKVLPELEKNGVNIVKISEVVN
ncbi:MAG: divergent polysaccharide deacetylase family protein [Calditerrivibrio sp.]|nr:divergent polysaccharide deacetylase family protein [Calditerrivibrio sp.]MCA1933347.1 divergent polysaccharide deacetylase family protein [Calditerrivibrio sp.]MCA1980521.1 divergent polysaccharide deacetylase family protein [Calditerrivibrio sp.]